MNTIIRLRYAPGKFRDDAFIGPFSTKAAADYYSWKNGRSLPGDYTVTGREWFTEYVVTEVDDATLEQLRANSAARREPIANSQTTEQRLADVNAFADALIAQGVLQ